MGYCYTVHQVLKCAAWFEVVWLMIHFSICETMLLLQKRLYLFSAGWDDASCSRRFFFNNNAFRFHSSSACIVAAAAVLKHIIGNTRQHSFLFLQRWYLQLYTDAFISGEYQKMLPYLQHPNILSGKKNRSYEFHVTNSMYWTFYSSSLTIFSHGYYHLLHLTKIHQQLK